MESCLPLSKISRHGAKTIAAVHLSTDQPYGAGPKAAKADPKRIPKRAPKGPLRKVLERPSFRASSGEIYPAFKSMRLGPLLSYLSNMSGMNITRFVNLSVTERIPSSPGLLRSGGRG